MSAQRHRASSVSPADRYGSRSSCSPTPTPPCAPRRTLAAPDRPAHRRWRCSSPSARISITSSSTLPPSPSPSRRCCSCVSASLLPHAAAECRWACQLTAGILHIWRTIELRQVVAAGACTTAVFGFAETISYAIAADGPPPLAGLRWCPRRAAGHGCDRGRTQRARPSPPPRRGTPDRRGDAYRRRPARSLQDPAPAAPGPGGRHRLRRRHPLDRRRAHHSRPAPHPGRAARSRLRGRRDPDHHPADHFDRARRGPHHRGRLPGVAPRHGRHHRPRRLVSAHPARAETGGARGHQHRCGRAGP